MARELGLRVLLGLWISRDKTHNEREIELATRTARQHRETIRAIVVGNEVLLRREQTPADLSVLLRRVATATGLPVTYADVSGVLAREQVTGAVRFFRDSAHTAVLG